MITLKSHLQAAVHGRLYHLSIYMRFDSVRPHGGAIYNNTKQQPRQQRADAVHVSVQRLRHQLQLRARLRNPAGWLSVCASQNVHFCAIRGIRVPICASTRSTQTTCVCLCEELTQCCSSRTTALTQAKGMSRMQLSGQGSQQHFNTHLTLATKVDRH